MPMKRKILVVVTIIFAGLFFYAMKQSSIESKEIVKVEYKNIITKNRQSVYTVSSKNEVFIIYKFVFSQTDALQTFNQIEVNKCYELMLTGTSNKLLGWNRNIRAAHETNCPE